MQVFMRCTDREGERGEESRESKSKGTRREKESMQEDGKRMGICKDWLIGVATGMGG